MNLMFSAYFILAFTLVSSAQTFIGPAIHADRPSPSPAQDPVGTRPFTLQFGHNSAKSLTKVLETILNRFSTIGIEEIVLAQRANQVSEKTYVARLNLSGAAFFDHEFQDDPTDAYTHVGKNAGVELVPFTVSLAPRGQYYLSIGTVSFRNMNAEQNGSHAWRNKNHQISGFWKIVDNVDFLVFKFDQNFTYSNLSSKHLELLSFDAKMDFLGSSVGTRYLAIKLGGSISTDTESFEGPDKKTTYLSADFGGTTTPNSTTPPTQEWDPANSNINFSFKYGLEFNTETSTGFKLSIQTLMSQKWMNGKAIDADRYAQYEENGGSGPDNRIVNYSHNFTYLDPDLEISQRVSKNTKKAVYLGGGFSGHLPLSDIIQTNGTLGRVDVAPYNNQLVKVKLFVHF